MTNDAERLTVEIPGELARRLDTYWHTRRLPSKSETVRELLALALDHAMVVPKHPQTRRKPAK